MTWKKIRKLLNDIHLWLGLASGLVVFVVCLTGTIYTFHTEIDEWHNSDKYKVAYSSDGKNIEELIQTLSNQVDGNITSVTIYPSRTDAYRFSVRKNGERRGTTYLVNPYTGEVLGDTQTNASEFFMTMFRLHRWLLLDIEIGRPIVGWSTVIFIFMIITGLIIWIPQKAKSWKQGLKIKWKSNWKRINHDLHNSLGFYAAIFLLIMGLTGLQWSFESYRSGLRSLLGVESTNNGEVEIPTIPDSSKPLKMKEFMKVCNTEFPYQGPFRIEIPQEDKVDIMINKYRSGFFASPSSDVLRVNIYSGKVISKEVFSDKPFNEKVARSIKALHVGDVFGTFSKILYFISCLIATSLPVTGTLIWFNKMKKKK